MLKTQAMDVANPDHNYFFQKFLQIFTSFLKVSAKTNRN